MIVTCKITSTLSRKLIQKNSEVLTSIEPNETHATFHLNLTSNKIINKPEQNIEGISNIFVIVDDYCKDFSIIVEI